MLQAMRSSAKFVFWILAIAFIGGFLLFQSSGLIGRATDLRGALAEKERLYFAEHRHGNATAKANGVTFEGAAPRT